jgi:hypothetical protein
MQKVVLIALLCTGMVLGTSRVEAQHYYVRDRPTERVITRPPAPSRRHVWVRSEWTWNNGRYAEVPAHWDLPPRGRKTWVAGRWVRDRKGSYWIAGRWR